MPPSLVWAAVEQAAEQVVEVALDGFVGVVRDATGNAGRQCHG